MIKRAITERILQLAECFPVVMVCGPRQVGKTTILKEICMKISEDIEYITFDDLQERYQAQDDPKSFLQRHSAPMLVDEFQYAPDILSYIKIDVDLHQKNGMYFLTGSQMFSMMRNAGESLAGRVGILDLYSFSYSEIIERENKVFLPELDLKQYAGINQRNLMEIFEHIFRGSMPKVVTTPNLSAVDYYRGYVRTYIERDIRDMINAKYERKYLRFLSCMAARAGQEFIASELAKEVEVDNKTINNWVSILETTGIVYMMQPYFSNMLKRITKRHRIYFLDTGLVCYLNMFQDARAAESSSMSGALFENYVISEIIKSYVFAGLDPKMYLYYYRDSSQKEIDLLIQKNGKLYPVEIKKNTSPGQKAMKNFSVLEGMEVGAGAIICMTDIPAKLSDNVVTIPADWI